jgi:hypothetical protein
VATAFLIVCAVASLSFVAANGGLQVPQLVAAESARTSDSPAAVSPPPATIEPTLAPEPSPASTAALPTANPPPTPEPTPVATPNPMTLLPRCPDFPDCWEYTIRRGDTLSEISDHYLISVQLLEWLNPQITDPSTIVVGAIVYLGFDGYARLHLCPDQPGCYLYVVRPGDRLSTIAGHLGITTQAIVDFDPAITDPNTIYSGQTIRVPGEVFCCG